IRHFNKVKKDNILLSSIIAERRIVEEKIEKQNKELIKANAELDSFVYSASHDLRAPLRSILGLIDIAGANEKDAEKKEIFNMMRFSVGKLDVFIKDIIEYSRNSRLEVKPEKIDLDKRIKESIAQLHYMDDGEKIKINGEIRGETDFYSDKK